MKRGKHEEKSMGPMFPRLHVNDTEKGGPRGPPRNKMALYEQFTIPSQRLNNKAANSEPPSKQGGGNEGGVLHSMATPHQSEKLYSQYSEFTIPLAQAEQRKKLDEDDFRVPIFTQSFQNQQGSKFSNDLNREKHSTSNPSDFRQLLNFHLFKAGLLEGQEGKSQKEENPKEIAGNQVIAVSSKKAEILKRQRDSSVGRDSRDNPANNSIDRLEIHDLVEPELLSVSGENFAALDKNYSDPVRASRSEDQKGSQDKSFRSLHKRGDSVCEASVVDPINGVDITPDDVVEVIGHKRFWKARKAILNQQRIFAVQVFELHRLVKVQKLIAASPQLLADVSSHLGKPTKASPGPKFPSDCPIKPIPNVLKQKGEPEKPSQKKECTAGNTMGKQSSSFQNSALPPMNRPLNGPANTSPSARPWCFNQPQGHQWLIPVMSPSEGLVYKPYPGPSFPGAGCTGCGPPATNPNSLSSSYLTPAYGILAPPSFPPAGPVSYFPTYGMPNMHGAAVSGSSVEQPNAPANPSRNSAGDLHHQKNRASLDALNSSHGGAKEGEVQDSTASSQVERLRDSRGKGDDTEGANELPLFPMAPATDAPNPSPDRPKPDRPTHVIKVVPHNGRSATESAARIFRSIQEERKQF